MNYDYMRINDKWLQTRQHDTTYWIENQILSSQKLKNETDVDKFIWMQHRYIPTHINKCSKYKTDPLHKLYNNNNGPIHSINYIGKKDWWVKIIAVCA